MGRRGRSGAWLAGLASASRLAAGRAGPAAAAQAAEPPECLYPGSDAFDGTASTRERWTSTLRHDALLYEVADGKAKVQTGPHEIQENDDGGAPNIFLQPAPEGTWEITTKVKIDARPTRASRPACCSPAPTATTSSSSPTSRRARTGTSGSSSSRSSTAGTTSAAPGTPRRPDYPDELWLRYRSDGTAVGLLLGRRRRDVAPGGGPAQLRGDRGSAGRLLRAPRRRRGPRVTAEFDSFDLVPANDEFDGDAIDECRWTEIRNRNDAGLTSSATSCSAAHAAGRALQRRVGRAEPAAAADERLRLAGDDQADDDAAAGRASRPAW